MIYNQTTGNNIWAGANLHWIAYFARLKWRELAARAVKRSQVQYATFTIGSNAATFHLSATLSRVHCSDRI